MNKKEIFWLIGTIILVLVIIFLIFDLKVLSPESLFDINIHDTYFVIPTSYLVVLFCILTFFGVYFIRMLRRNFKNKTANFIFLIANILLILKLTQSMYMLGTFTRAGGTIDQSAPANETITNFGNWISTFSEILLAIQALLLILVTFCAKKQGNIINNQNKK